MLENKTNYEVLEGKAVFPIVSTEKRINYQWNEISKNLDKRIQPITKDECDSIRSSGYSLPEVVNEDMILIRHPYRPNTLVDSNYDMQSYIEEKFGDYAVILNYLGATEQVLKAKITKRQTRTIEANGKIKSKAKFSLKGAFKRLTTDRFEVCYSLIINSKGGVNYEGAKKYAQEVGLENDPFVKMVLGLQEKPVKSLRADKVISKDYTDIFDAAATLQLMDGVFKLDGDFCKKVSSKEEISICQDLKFSKIG